MFNNFTRLLTLLLSAYVLYIIIQSSFNTKEEGFIDINTNTSQTTPPPEYDPYDLNVFNQPFDESKVIEGDYRDIINLRKPIKYNPECLKKDPSYLGRPYRLDRKSILKISENDNKYLEKEQDNLANLNFLYPKSHSQTDFSGIHSSQRNVQIRTDPANPRLDQNPWTIKKNDNIFRKV